MRTVQGIVPSVLALVLSAAVSGRGAESAVVDLKLTSADARAYRGLNADAKGTVEIKPFANAAGRLMFHVAADSVRADTNGDGTIDDSDAPAVKPQRTTVTVAARCGTSAIEYPFEILYVRGNMLVVGSRAKMEGRWNDRLVGIGDANLDGVFGGRGDSLSISAAGTAGDPGAAVRLPWARTLGVDAGLYAIEMEGADKLRIDAYKGPASELRVAMEPAPDEVDLQLINEAASFCATVRSIAGPVRVVPGTCRVYGTFGWKAGGTKMYLRGFPKPVVLGAAPLTLRIGPPLKVDFEAVRDGQDIAIRNVKITGASGENWQPAVRNKADGPAAYVRAGAREHRLATLEYG